MEHAIMIKIQTIKWIQDPFETSNSGTAMKIWCNLFSNPNNQAEWEKNTAKQGTIGVMQQGMGKKGESTRK